MMQNLVSVGDQPARTSLLSREYMEHMGQTLISACNQLEEHGLVDYQMGLWEEEIICGKLIPNIVKAPDLTLPLFNSPTSMPRRG